MRANYATGRRCQQKYNDTPKVSAKAHAEIRKKRRRSAVFCRGRLFARRDKAISHFLHDDHQAVGDEVLPRRDR